MKFSKQERKEAAKYGLRLGEPYKSVKRNLTRQGWVVDRVWLERERSGPLEDGDLICGNGYNMVCSTAFMKKNRKRLYVSLSGTNEGTPLYSVGTEP